MSRASTLNCSDWSLIEWNTRLVEAVFESGPMENDITRIEGTSRFLCTVAGASESNAENVRSRFLSAFPARWRDIAQLYDSSRWCKWDPSEDELPFFAQLYLTIMVAAADEETHNLGQFRDRFVALLGLPKGHTYISYGLPDLWRLAERWSQEQFKMGRFIRVLVLPDPGSETIVGYSKRLAFPTIVDQKRLAVLMEEKKVDSDAPLHDLIKVINKRIGVFSDRFEIEYRKFKEALHRQNELAAIRTPFWGVIQDLTWSESNIERRRQKLTLRVDLNLAERFRPHLTLVSDTLLQEEDAPLKELPKSIRPEHEYYYEYYDPNTDGPKINQFMSCITHFAGPRIKQTNMSRMIEQGAIFFARHGMGYWRSVDRILVGAQLIALHRNANPIVEWYRRRIEKNKGTQLVSFPVGNVWYISEAITFTSEMLEEAQMELPSQIIFNRRLTNPRIRLLDQIRMSGETLFLDPRLPKVEMRFADSITWTYRDSSEKKSSAFEMEYLSGAFEFKVTDAKKVSGHASIAISAFSEDGIEITSRTLDVATFCTTLALPEQAVDTSKLIDGNDGQLKAAAADKSAKKDRYYWKSLAPSVYTLPARRPVVPDEEISLNLTKVQDLRKVDERWERLLEILCAYFTDAKWLAPNDLVGIVEDIFESQYDETWNRIRSLETNYILRRYYNAQWRGSVFSYVAPKAYIKRNIIRILGLTSNLLRRKIRSSVEQLGGTCALIFGRTELGALEIEVPPNCDLGWLVSSLRLPYVTAEIKADPIASWDKLVRFQPIGELAMYNANKITYWLPEKGYFSSEPSGAVGGVSLERWSLNNAQPLFVMRYGQKVWCTNSRDWAVAAYVVSTGANLAYIGVDGSVECAYSTILMPPAVSFATVVLGGGVVARSLAGNLHYPAGRDYHPADTISAWIAYREEINDARAAQGRRALALYLHGYRSVERTSMVGSSVWPKGKWAN